MRPVRFSSKLSLFVKAIKRLFRFAGIEIISDKSYFDLTTSARLGKDLKNQIEFCRKLPSSAYQELLPIIGESKSQLQQDMFVLWQTSFKQGGYFVEFGATDGKSLSNTFLLEDKFQWNGILAEPAQIWHTDLLKNRPNCNIEYSCIWGTSGETVYFNETRVPELSTVSNFRDVDLHADARRSAANVYRVETMSLIDLLRKYEAPRHIDYLSIDTEGSEYEVLKNFDFTKYSFSVITVEHNFTPNRERIFDLLISKGYERILLDHSQFDDWYVYTD